MNLAHIVAQIKAKTRTLTKPTEGAGGIIWDPVHQKILVVKGIKWSLPKGHLKPGELPHEGAQREIFEETSLQIKISDTWKSRKIRRYVYYYMILENAHVLSLNPIDLTEIHDLRWCSREDLKLMECNKQLQYVLTNWSVMIKFLEEHKQELTLMGTVPTLEMCQILQQDLLSK